MRLKESFVHEQEAELWYRDAEDAKQKNDWDDYKRFINNYADEMKTAGELRRVGK